jgi:hypothetical protein
VEQEPALVRLDSGAAFDPVLQQRQRTRPRKQFRKDSPEKRSDVQPPENRVGARQPSADNHPQNEQRMQEEDGSRANKGKVSGETVTVQSVAWNCSVHQ